MFKPILVWFGFLAVVRYQTLFLEEAKDISKFLSGTLQSKGPLKMWVQAPDWVNFFVLYLHKNRQIKTILDVFSIIQVKILPIWQVLCKK